MKQVRRAMTSYIVCNKTGKKRCNETPKLFNEKTKMRYKTDIMQNETYDEKKTNTI